MLSLATNFLRPLAIYRRPLIYTGYLLAIFFLLLAIFMWFHARQLHSKAELAQISSQQLQASLLAAKNNTQAFPDPADLLVLKSQVDSYNQLFGEISMSVADLLSLLENIMPKEVQLLDLNYRARGDAIRLTAASANNAALLMLLEAMQNHPQLSQVILLNRTEAELSKQGLVQYQLKFSAHD